MRSTLAVVVALVAWACILLVGMDAFSADWQGCPVAGVANGFTVVDPRPALDSLSFNSPKASYFFRELSPKAKLMRLSTRAGYPRIEASTKWGKNMPHFFGGPDCQTALTIALFHDGRGWVAEVAGATRRGEFEHVFDNGDGKWTPISAIPGHDAQWGSPWPRTAPTMLAFAASGQDQISYAVVVSGETAADPVEPEPGSSQEILDDWTVDELVEQAAAHGWTIQTETITTLKKEP